MTFIMTMKNNLSKLVVILGPTASGKSDLAIKLAKKFKGEIISADSRQIYKGMDIGTAKPKGHQSSANSHRSLVSKGIRHYMINTVKPSQTLTLTEYKDRAIEVINNITRRGKVPFLVGGTGLYISSIVNNWLIPKVRPSKKLRNELEGKTNKWLFKQLKKLDRETAANIDPQNKRRLVRALEVCLTSDLPFSKQRKRGNSLFNILEIGLDLEREKLYKGIGKRVDLMIRAGLVREVKSLIRRGYGWHLPAMSGIGYRQVGQYLRGEISLERAIELIKRDTRRYAKRQLTWFRKDKRIRWIGGPKEAEKLIKKFLKNGSYIQ
jgi:tRNA dimethylallyltransferase